MSKQDIVGIAANYEYSLRAKGAFLALQEVRIQWQNEQARRGLEWAKMGDWDALARHIREGGKITKEIANFIVGVLEGNERRPANKAETHEGREKIVRLV